MGTIFTVKKMACLALPSWRDSAPCRQEWNRTGQDSTGVTREYAWGQR